MLFIDWLFYVYLMFLIFLYSRRLLIFCYRGEYLVLEISNDFFKLVYISGDVRFLFWV